MSERLGVFVITKGSVGFLDLGEAEPVRDLARRLADALAHDDKKERCQALATELGKAVLGPPFAALPASVKTLVIAPDRELSCVPFDGLSTGDDHRPTGLDFAFAYAHSGLALTASKSLERPPFFLGFGHPSYSDDISMPALTDAERVRGVMSALPESAHEVIEIAELFASSDSERQRLGRLAALDFESSEFERAEDQGDTYRILLGAAAREAAATSPEFARASVVHFACHAHGDIVSPELSYLALSDSSDDEDGLLWFDEIGLLDLNADLVVLSACETARGVVRTYEGSLGLSRAVLMAGAKAVLATLWKVGDESSREIVVDFYRGWLSDGLSRVDALARAKRNAYARGIPMRDWSAWMLWDSPQ